MPYNGFPLQGGGLLCPVESVPALAAAPMELWRQRGKPLTLQARCFKVFTLYEWFDCQYVTEDFTQFNLIQRDFD